MKRSGKINVRIGGVREKNLRRMTFIPARFSKLNVGRFKKR